MPQTFDLILKGGTVVNHDGRAERDIGIAAAGSPPSAISRRPSAGETIDCRGPAHPAGRHRHARCISASRASTTRKIWKPARAPPCMGGVTAVFEMPNTEPQTTTPEALADKVRRGHHRMHCDFAFWVGGTHENADEVAELERLPGAAGIKVFMGSSTGSLLVEDDDGIAEYPARTRRRAAFHSEDEADAARAQASARRGRPALASGLARSAEVALPARSAWCASRAKPARASTCCMSRPREEMALLKDHKDVASVEVTPHHLTLAAPEDYERLGT